MRPKTKRPKTQKEKKKEAAQLASEEVMEQDAKKIADYEARLAKSQESQTKETVEQEGRHWKEAVEKEVQDLEKKAEQSEDPNFLANFWPWQQKSQEAEKDTREQMMKDLEKIDEQRERALQYEDFDALNNLDAEKKQILDKMPKGAIKELTKKEDKAKKAEEKKEEAQEKYEKTGVVEEGVGQDWVPQTEKDLAQEIAVINKQLAKVSAEHQHAEQYEDEETLDLLEGEKELLEKELKAKKQMLEDAKSERLNGGGVNWVTDDEFDGGTGPKGKLKGKGKGKMKNKMKGKGKVGGETVEGAKRAPWRDLDRFTDESQEEQELEPASFMEKPNQMESLMYPEVEAMKVKLMGDLQQYMDADQKKQIADEAKKEKRWAAILHRQQKSLLQHEQALKSEEKDLLRMKREKQWQKGLAETVRKSEAASCAGKTQTVRAFISASESHASCLKTQLGVCVNTEVTTAPSLSCDEPSAGWQKKCLADKAAEMKDCAPLGVDWTAMRRGNKGSAADNEALEQLTEWCTFHRALGKIAQSKSTAPFSLILSHDAALSKDAVHKLGEFGANFNTQQWDLLQVDPIGTPAPLHTVLVKTESAEKIQKAMSQMKAMPLDKMPKALNNDGTAKAVSWTAGVAGLLQTENADCSLQSPALLRPLPKAGKLATALR